MDRNRRQLIQDIEGMGLEIIDTRANKHFVFKLRNKHGVVQSVTAAMSPSNHRSRSNQLSVLRAFANREA